MLLLLSVSNSLEVKRFGSGDCRKCRQLESRSRRTGVALLILAGYLLFAHGCHGSKDNELSVLPETETWKAKASPSEIE